MTNEIIKVENKKEPTPQEIIVHVAGVSADGKASFLLSLIPGDTDLNTLQLRREDGGLTFRDGQKYAEWDGCRCELIDLDELKQKYPTQGKLLPRG